MIYAGSRYETATVDFVLTGKDKFGQFVVPAPVQPLGIQYVRYVTEYGDTFDSLAARIGGDPLKWWVIADLNPQVLFPSDLAPGTIIRLPV